jgi:hypothetical protein
MCRNFLLLLTMSDLFNPNCSGYAQDNLGVKKVSALLKNPAKCPITCFYKLPRNQVCLENPHESVQNII